MKSILDHKKISKSYFYPRHSKFKEPFYVTNGNNKLACYYHKIQNAKKTVIHFHGNGEVVSDYIDDFDLRMEAMGCSVLLAEYRRYGLSSGDFPSLVEMLDDVEHIIKSIDVPMEDIILFGRSVGSIYALHGAYLFPNISGLIIESGIADVVSRVLMRVNPKGINSTKEILIEEGEKYFNHQKKIANFQGKTLIMHTKYDSLVNSENAIKLYNWANKPKELKLFEFGDHNNIYHINCREYDKLVEEFINSTER